eukprot:TRINITY_DN851_c0_g1_i1.p1 TRINITY_DN851_c0_g1~~TRINITY_DN851_c0_g1_i1.p1  ORF type:complete len:181 (+),score=51.51 TRINITY_DN851_c0_g1_i1:76-618(+)
MNRFFLLLALALIAVNAQNFTYVAVEGFSSRDCTGQSNFNTFHTSGVCYERTPTSSIIYFCREVGGVMRGGYTRYLSRNCDADSQANTEIPVPSCDQFTDSSFNYSCTNTLPSFVGKLVETKYSSNTTCEGQIVYITLTPGCNRGTGCVGNGVNYRCGNDGRRLGAGILSIFAILSVFLL